MQPRATRPSTDIWFKSVIRNCNVQIWLWRGRGCQACLIITTRPELTVDGFRPHINAAEDGFGANVDFGTLIKTPQESSDLNKRYSPGEFVNALSTLVTGNLKAHLFSTSHSEGQNFTVEMQLLRFTRLTNSYSNKLSHLIYFIRWDEKAGLQRDAICSQRSTRSKPNGKETGL